MDALPTGTVTFLFTNIEGSCSLWQNQPAAARQSVVRHDAILEAEVEKHHGAKVPVYIYEGAGHGFNNQSPERYNAEAADLARHRTLELFDAA